MKKYFDNNLDVKDIVVRQDEDENGRIQDTACFYYPLIRIGDFVFHRSSIISFNMEVGKSLVPTARIVLDDYGKHIQEENINKGEIKVTFRISNNADTVYKPIKSDFLVTKLSSSNNYVTLYCEMHIPLIWKKTYRAFDNTTFNILKDIAQECNMGFYSNVSDTNDKQTWIQTNRNYDFIKELSTRSFITKDDSMHIFIDQFSNLNVVSLQNAISNRTSTIVKTKPYTGEKLDTPFDCVFTNHPFSMDDDEPTSIQIVNYSPSTNFGNEATEISKIENYSVSEGYDYLNDEVNTFTVQSERSYYSEDNINTWYDIDNVYENYSISKQLNIRNKRILMQNNILNIELPYYLPFITCMMYSHIEIYNLLNRKRITDQDTTKTQTEIIDEGEPITELSNNENFTGEYIIKDITYSYIDGGDLKQNINVMLV